MKKILVLVFLLPLISQAQHNLSVEINGVRTSNGSIKVAVYNKSDNFLKFDQVFKADSVKAQKGITRISLNDLPEGEYALAIFHDENNNEKLDTNWLGVPKEDIGFSNASMKTFGPPPYKECAFKLINSHEIQISL
ncbi:MAG: DUF2141 domain-containing protein [Flavobacteriaceae bacterium]|nr:DUF2141 domain-containing protein [Flavobacteriaceae bacterium]